MTHTKKFQKKSLKSVDITGGSEADGAVGGRSDRFHLETVLLGRPGYPRTTKLFRHGEGQKNRSIKHYYNAAKCNLLSACVYVHFEFGIFIYIPAGCFQRTDHDTGIYIAGIWLR